ncbi:proteasome assembly chaperone 3-like [Biomphalaria glabrata]|uniref:Proteasome assembly chaperone 3-like n=1 Tax=Biomphalaria glabrata TaxID=6526 RepID=A0A9U8EB62_BIOGL|nr:proteasome assembly chaperone 3-like [Biomphalaria glabrata]KAI8773714.1 proteasome assembly chaperone 3 [Biomphalaria glabrata]
MAASLKSPIVQSKQIAKQISDHHTEVVVNKFEDHLFIIASQYMKMGTILQVTRDILTHDIQDNIPMFSTKVLLGKDEPITHVMAKTIVTALNPLVPVIMSLAIKDTSPDTVHSITDMIKSCL